MMVEPERAAAKAAHAGKTYYFCGKGCAERFSAEPEKFLASSNTQTKGHGHLHGIAPAKSSATVGTRVPTPTPASPPEGKTIRYTCPMHPEVVQWGPGSCPKCGMALEPMDIAAEEAGPDPEYVSMRLRFWVSAALTLPVLLLGMFGEHAGLSVSGASRHWIELALASPVVLWGGWPFSSGSGHP